MKEKEGEGHIESKRQKLERYEGASASSNLTKKKIEDTEE